MEGKTKLFLHQESFAVVFLCCNFPRPPPELSIFSNTQIRVREIETVPLTFISDYLFRMHLLIVQLLLTNTLNKNYYIFEVLIS